ncbi:hypothetical protein IWX92DRAFT_223042 [Phyllosticta citricarpa]
MRHLRRSIRCWQPPPTHCKRRLPAHYPQIRQTRNLPRPRPPAMPSASNDSSLLPVSISILRWPFPSSLPLPFAVPCAHILRDDRLPLSAPWPAPRYALLPLHVFGALPSSHSTLLVLCSRLRIQNIAPRLPCVTPGLPLLTAQSTWLPPQTSLTRNSKPKIYLLRTTSTTQMKRQLESTPSGIPRPGAKTQNEPSSLACAPSSSPSSAEPTLVFAQTSTPITAS